MEFMRFSLCPAELQRFQTRGEAGGQGEKMVEEPHTSCSQETERKEKGLVARNALPHKHDAGGPLPPTMPLI